MEDIKMYPAKHVMKMKNATTKTKFSLYETNTKLKIKDQ
jgi:hypothetical protein